MGKCMKKSNHLFTQTLFLKIYRQKPCGTIEFFAVCTNVADLTFLSMLTCFHTKDLILDICGKHLNNSELHKYSISIRTNCTSLFSAGADILSQHNIYIWAGIYNIGRNVRSVTFVETAETSNMWDNKVYYGHLASNSTMRFALR